MKTMYYTNWVKKQIVIGNLVEDGTGCVANLETAARELDDHLVGVASDDEWAVDKTIFRNLAKQYVGFAPKDR